MLTSLYNVEKWLISKFWKIEKSSLEVLVERSWVDLLTSIPLWMVSLSIFKTLFVALLIMLHKRMEIWPTHFDND